MRSKIGTSLGRNHNAFTAVRLQIINEEIGPDLLRITLQVCSEENLRFLGQRVPSTIPGSTITIILVAEKDPLRDNLVTARPRTFVGSLHLNGKKVGQQTGLRK